MNVTLKPVIDRFAIGQPVSRKEDPMLLRGEGRYTDDLSLPGQVHAVMVRSRYAHGMLRGVDTAEAKAMPGVLAVLTAADLDAGGIKPMQASSGTNRDGSPTARPLQTALARDKVRYVGDPVACVVAETAKQAKDAAEAVLLDVDPLPAVTGAREAAAPDAPLVHNDAPGNLIMDYHHGDAAAVAAAFASAAHVTKLSIRNSRIVVSAMEPRSALGSFDAADGRYTLRVGCQGVWGMKHSLKDVLGVPAEKVHVLTGNVGGSFGMKASVYPEYPCLLLAARLLGRPVKWTDERSESFLSDSHGRGPRSGCRAGAGRGRPIPGGARACLRQSRGIPEQRDDDSAHGQHDQEHGGRVCDEADRGFVPMRVHQHDAGGPIPGRGAAGGQLLYGTADRHGGGRNRDRPGRAAPSEPYPAGADAVCGPVRHGIRQR